MLRDGAHTATNPSLPKTFYLPETIVLAVVAMENVFVTVDKFGRILLPKKVREEIGAETFAVKVMPNELRLKTVHSLREMRGSMKNLDLKEFKHQHAEDSR